MKIERNNKKDKRGRHITPQSTQSANRTQSRMKDKNISFFTRHRKGLLVSGTLLLIMMTGVSFTAKSISEKFNPYSQELSINHMREKITQSFTILDRNEQPLQEDIQSVKYDPVDFTSKGKWNIDQLYLDTILAVEDDSFYTRWTKGYSIKGTLGAVVSQVKEKLGKGGGRGGSTIDQQLAKIITEGTGHQNTMSDKIVQLLDARKLAQNYSRDEILRAYLNELRLVPNTVGVKAASLYLFNNDMSNLDTKKPESIAQIAYIAGLGQAPSVYVQQFDTAGKERTLIVLGIMKEQELISEREFNAAKDYVKSDQFKIQAHITNGVQKEYQPYVSKVMQEVEEMNLPTNASVKIKTYADKGQLEQLHAIATGQYPSDSRIPNMYIEHPESLTAISAIDTKTGHILGIATNSENPLIPFEAERSSGSTIKPLLDYAPAVEFAGLTPGTPQNGNSYTIGDWTVVNYGGYNYGKIRADKALGISLNTAAVEAFRMTNDSQKQAIMGPLGMQDDNPNGNKYNPEQGINYPTNTLTLASAFSTFGNDGIRVTPSAIDYIEVDGTKIKKEEPKAQRAMSSSTAKTMVEMLKEVTKPGGSEPNSGPQFVNQPEDTYVMKSGLSNFDSTVPNSSTKSPDALLAMSSPEVSIATWIGSPSYTDATYAPNVEQSSPGCNARVYLMNNAMKVMMQGRTPNKFQFTDGKLSTNTKEIAIPKEEHPVKNNLDGFNPKTPKIDQSKQKDYDKMIEKSKELETKKSQTYMGE